MHTRDFPKVEKAEADRSVAHHWAVCLCLLLVMLAAHGCGGEESPTPTATSEAAASPPATSTHTQTPEATPTEVPPTFTATLVFTPSPSPTSTDTPSPVPTPTYEPPTSTATLEATPSPSPTSTDTPSPVPTPTYEPPTSTATLEATPSPSPTSSDTPTPVATPTEDLPTPTETPDAVDSQPPDLLDQTYSSPSDGFEIRPPRDWAVDTSGLLGTKVIFRSETSDLHDEAPFHANVNVLTVPAQGITLEELAAASKEQFKILVTDFTLLGETFLVVEDLEAHLFEYTFSQGVFPLRGTHLIIVYEGTAYAVTATALNATWEEYEGAFNASLRSFRILADSPSPDATHAPSADATDGSDSPASTEATESVDSQSPAALGPAYSNSTDGFELRPPYGWVVDDSGLSGTNVAFIHTPPDFHGETQFSANIIVQIGPTDGRTLEEIVQETKEQFPQMLMEFNLLRDDFAIVNGKESRVLEFTFDEDTYPLRIRQLFLIHEDKVYAITATALDAVWDKYENAFDASLRSFRILPASQSTDPLGPLYSDSINGFEIRPPSGWTVDRSGLVGTKVAFIHPEPDFHDRTPFSANIVIYVEPAEGLTLEEFVELSREQSSLLLTDFALLRDESATVNGRQIHFLETTFTHGVFPARNRQLIAIYEDNVYAITTTALEATWQQYEAVFDASLRSFRILGAGDTEGS